MFKDTIVSTVMTEGIADSYFDNVISGTSWVGYDGCVDNTFLSTCRALLHERIDGSLRVVFSDWSVYPDVENGLFFDECEHRNVINGNTLNEMLIINIRGSKEKTSEFINSVNEINGYNEIEKIRNYFTSFHVRCFVNEQFRNTIFIVERMNAQKLHILQGAILPSVPWYYNKDSKPLTEEEIALVKSLQSEDSREYIDAINKIAEKIDFVSDFIRKNLAGFEIECERRQRDCLEATIKDRREQIRELQTRISNILFEIRRANNELSGVLLSMEENQNENHIMNYFLSNSRLEFVRKLDYGDGFMFNTFNTLSVWNEDLAESTINNVNSFIYNRSSDITTEEQKMFYRAVFIDKIAKINVWGRFMMSTTECDASARDAETSRCEQYLPNPHIWYHRCTGGYRENINDAIICGNYTLAVDNCLTSTANINFNDSTVMSEFRNQLFGDIFRTRKFVEMDGERMTVRETIERLKERNYE